MTNLPIGHELDAAVLRAIGWEYQPGYENEMVTVADVFVRPDQCDIFVIGKSRLSTSDPEAMRLCGPWLRERAEHCSITIYGKRPHAEYERDYVSIHINLYDELSRPVRTRAKTFAHALCLAVLAVAAREAERKDATS